jgi:hypothetical protein
MRPWLATAAALLLVLLAAPSLCAQQNDDALSQKEIESLRDAAYIPADRVAAFEKILNTREQEIHDLLAKPHRPGFSEDMHDFIDQFSAISDEFNDNLDEFSTRHRDVRKALPKLLSDIERWSSTLRAPPEDDAYDIVRRIALDNLKDMHDEASTMRTEQAAYFKANPDAARTEKERADENHAPVQNESPN